MYSVNFNEEENNKKKKAHKSLFPENVNDLGVKENETFKQNLESIIVTAKEINPDCELLLVSTMIPNSEAVIQNSTQSYMGNIPEQEGMLIDLYNGEMSQDTKTELGDTKIAVAPMTTFSQYLYSAGKRFADIGSNNVNHPNDFLHRLQAQVVLKTLLGDDFTVL